MRISDVVSGANLTIFPEIGLALFLGIFIGAVIYTFVAYRGDYVEKMSQLPLDSTSANGEKDV